MKNVYFVCDRDKIVFTFTAVGDGTWRFSRLSPFQRGRELDKFVLLYRVEEQPGAWVVQDRTSGNRGEIIGRCRGSLGEGVHVSNRPFLGPWFLWGCPFTLTAEMPRRPAAAARQEIPFPLEVPFATVQYAEEGSIARLEVTMKGAPIADECLEMVLKRFRELLRNLAGRPEMVLLIRSDARNSAVPSVRHIRRFLSFVQEHGSEFVLVGRGTAIVLRPRGILGSTLLALLRVVQRLLPTPWPESVVSSMEEAEAFLSQLGAEAKAEVEELLGLDAAQRSPPSEAGTEPVGASRVKQLPGAAESEAGWQEADAQLDGAGVRPQTSQAASSSEEPPPMSPVIAQLPPRPAVAPEPGTLRVLQDEELRRRSFSGDLLDGGAASPGTPEAPRGFWFCGSCTTCSTDSSGFKKEPPLPGAGRRAGAAWAWS